ncbi:MAG: hypothetical protein OSA95_04150 [Opitutales bacterium]|nr:hypothetical protein [Opitutales bacterium]
MALSRDKREILWCAHKTGSTGISQKIPNITENFGFFFEWVANKGGMKGMKVPGDGEFNGVILGSLANHRKTFLFFSPRIC